MPKDVGQLGSLACGRALTSPDGHGLAGSRGTEQDGGGECGERMRR